jgi:hypothetical protein
VTLLNIIVLTGISALVVVITAIVNARTARKDGVVEAPVEYQDYYDESTMGTREVLSGIKHVFPIGLVQQIDISTQNRSHKNVLSVLVTAEFHRADFNFDAVAAEKFIVTMEQALDGFDINFARSAVSQAFLSGADATIYISPHYQQEG